MKREDGWSILKSISTMSLIAGFGMLAVPASFKLFGVEYAPLPDGVLYLTGGMTILGGIFLFLFIPPE